MKLFLNDNCSRYESKYRTPQSVFPCHSCRQSLVLSLENIFQIINLIDFLPERTDCVMNSSIDKLNSKNSRSMEM